MIVIFRSLSEFSKILLNVSSFRERQKGRWRFVVESPFSSSTRGYHSTMLHTAMSKVTEIKALQQTLANYLY
jgi:hypothetical protein